jgi:hypothetical protein
MGEADAMRRSLPVIAGLFLVLGFGLFEGNWTDRWLLSGAAEAAAARLPRVPEVIGDWEGKDEQLDARAVALADMHGYLLRTYTHRISGEQLQVLLVCGKPGPTSVHTPDVCYRGAGFALARPAQHREVEVPGANQRGKFWVGDFAKQDAAIPETLRIYWGWSAIGQWRAPDNPRLAFARYPALYKLYVIRPLTATNESLDNDIGREFLKVLLPVLNRELFAAS